MNKPVLALVALSMLPACPLLDDVEVEVPEVCITYPSIDVEPATEVHTRVVSDDHGGIRDLLRDFEGVRFRRAAAYAVSGVDNFDFVQTARIGIAPGADPTAPALTLYECDGNCVSTADSLALSDGEELEVRHVLAGETIALEIDLTGYLPQVAWTMDVEVCFEGNFTVGDPEDLADL